MGNKCCKRKGEDSDELQNASRRPLVKDDGEIANDSVIMDEIPERENNRSTIQTAEIEMVKTEQDTQEKDILNLESKGEDQAGSLTEVYNLDKKELSVDVTKAETQDDGNLTENNLSKSE